MKRLPFVCYLLFSAALCARAQFTAGGDAAGGYLWLHKHMSDSRMLHSEGKGNLWLNYKATNYDWRLSLIGKYKNVEGEKNVDDDKDLISDTPLLKSTSTSTNEKPLNLTARYDFNWRASAGSTYSLRAQYDYEHAVYENKSWGVMMALDPDVGFFGRFQNQKDVGHRMSVDYRGTTQLSAPGWALNSSAGASLLKKKVNDEWKRFDQTFDFWDEDTPLDTLRWMLKPKYTDYDVNAALQLTKTTSLNASATERWVLGGGIRFKGEGEKFSMHPDFGNGGDSNAERGGFSIDQRATGFRYFIEPFAGGEWRRGRWSVNAEYGLRLYNMSTTEKTGHAQELYNLMDKEHQLHDSGSSHFTPLANGSAKLTYTLSKHHSLSLTNSLTNRLPTHQQAVLHFIQTNEYNKVHLGNPHLKPETKILFSLDHTLSYGHFSATTSVSASSEKNLMEDYFFGWPAYDSDEVVRIRMNVANVSTYKLSGSLGWNSKWLEASATLWGYLAHYHGIGHSFSGHVVDDDNWGWQIDAKATLGCGWLVATNFQYKGRVKTITTRLSPVWQSSTVSVEKRFGHVTLYLNGSGLVDPAIIVQKHLTDGFPIYYSEKRLNNRVVMLGCRWTI